MSTCVSERDRKIEAIVKAIICLKMPEGLSFMHETATLIAEAAVATLEKMEEDLPVYRHNKRGELVTVIHEGKMQVSTEIKDNDPVVVYRVISSNDVWVRSTAEFHDGRFHRLRDRD